MICNKSGKEKRLIESIFEHQSALSLVFDFTEYVNVLKTETFSEFIEDYSELSDTIVVCNKVDKKINIPHMRYRFGLNKRTWGNNLEETDRIGQTKCNIFKKKVNICQINSLKRHKIL